MIIRRPIAGQAGLTLRRKIAMRPVSRPRRSTSRNISTLAVLELEARRLLAASDVLSYHDDTASTGQQEAEAKLTPQVVTASTFGKQFTTALDGQVYAQPLVKAGIDITGGAEPGVHDVVFVATEHDSVYAIDAQTGDVLWKTSFLDPANGVTTVPAPSDVNTSDLTPEIGITSTPVIDPATGLLYVLAQTKQVIGTDSADPHYIQTLHALNLATGQESAAGPAVVANTSYNQGTGVYTYNSGPAVNGTGDGSVAGKVYYNALREFQRVALTLVNGTVYFASASHGDNGPYHGWVLGYDAQTLALKAAFNATPNGGEGGIWQSGGQVASDAAGNLYVETGNGTFGDGTANANQLGANGLPIGGNYGDSFIKLAVDPTSSPTNQNINGWGLKVTDFFTPYNQLQLSNADLDLGSAAPLVLPDSAGKILASGSAQQLLVGSGKEGRIYLIDRNNMGGYDPNADHVTEEIPGALSGALDTAAYHDNTLYYVQGYGGVAKAFSLVNSVLSTTPTSESTDSFSFAGATPTVSSDGDGPGIVWTVERGTNQLRAYDSTNLADELWNSSEAPGNRDRLGSAIKFEVPTVANGMVYVGTTNSLVGYGLIVPPTTVPAAPTNLAAQTLSASQIALTWTDNARNESGFEIDQSTDGVNFYPVASPPVNSQSWLIGGLLPKTNYTFRVEATNVLGSSLSSNTASATTSALANGVDYSSGFAGAGSSVALNGTATIAGGDLRLTDTINTGEAGSAFAANQVDVGGFSTIFRFQMTDAEADGMAFVIQGQGPTALGETGGGLGYSGITPSVALKFDLYDNAGEGTDSTGLFSGGTYPSEPGSVDLTNTPIDLHSGDIFLAQLNYDGALLSVTITDTTTGLSAAQSYPVDIPGLLGSDLGYVGFTGGTGGLTVQSDILDWTYTPVSPAAPPVAPTSLTASVVDVLTVGLNWQDSPHATRYEIQREIAPGGTFATIATVGPNVSTYLDPGLSTGTRYVYRVRAINAAGASDYSNEYGVDTPTLAATPRNPRVVAETDRQIDFAWDDESDNETGFRIFRKVTSSGTFQYLTTVPANTTSYLDTGLAPSTFYDYHVQAINLAGYSDFAGISTTTLPPTLPAPWKEQDVGTPAIAGGADYAGGVYTVTASGQDIGDNADDFHFAYQALRGDGTITARVISLDNTDPNAKAGVMIRQTLDGASTDDFEAVSAANGVASIHRDQTGATSTDDGGPDVAAPYWVRLERVGSVITASTSPDGVTWTVSNTVDIAMGAEVFIGLAVTSDNDAQLAAAQFDNVTITQADYSGGVAIAVASTTPIGGFVADRWGEGGNTSTTTAPINTSRVANPAPQAVYQSERYGNFSYDVPDLRPYGLYTVRLDEAEIYYDQAGARQFNVEINGQTVLTNYDIFAAAGGMNIAVAPSFAAQADADGQIFVTFTAGAADAAKLDGLEILPRTAPAVASVVASTPSTTYGQAVRFVATLGAVDANQPTPTGQVLFFVDGRQVDSEPLGADGTATSAALANLGAGVHSVTVSYGGDSIFGTSTSTSTSLAVAPAPLRIVAADASKIYGAADPTFSISTAGFVLGQGLSDLAGSAVETSAASATSHVGTYAITPGGLASANYAITFVGGTLTVTPAPLTITADPATKVYGASLPPLTASYAGLVGFDTPASLAAAPKLATTAGPRSHVGTYAITAAGAASADYAITYVAGILTVTPAALTITAADASKVYGNPLPTLAAIYNGFLPGDGPSSLISPVVLGTAATGASHVGTYAITAAGATSADYAITFEPGTLTVTPAPLSIAVQDAAGQVGSPLPAFSARYLGLIPGDTPATLNPPIQFLTTATSTSPAGSYAITVAPVADPDYAVTYQSGVLTLTSSTSTPTPAVLQPPADYDGSGRTNLAIYFAAGGEFLYQPSSGGPAVAVPFGIGGAGQTLPAPGDYTGAGHTEIAAYIPSLGAYAIRPAGGGPDVVVPFGLPGVGQSLPAPGDYQGSGKDDIAVYMPSLGAFGIRPSTGGPDQIISFGIPGAGQSLAAPADYFGTGRDDIAVYLAAIGAFAIRNPAGGPDRIIPFGLPGLGQSIPIPGDYDGSGHVELAVYMPAIGAFAYRPYDGGPDVIEAFGTANDGSVPVPGDYDGAGHDEIAVYDPNSAVFAYRPARGGADVIQQFGSVGLATSLPAAAPAGSIPAEIQATSPLATASSAPGVVVSPTTNVPSGPTTHHRPSTHLPRHHRSLHPPQPRQLAGQTSSLQQRK